MNWPKIHHYDLSIQSIYEESCQKKFFDSNIGVDREFPKVDILKDGSYVIYKSDNIVEQSAWNSERIIDGSGWVEPKKTDADFEIEGNYIGFCSWYQGNYSHMLTDNLPYIAWLRNEFKNYNFLMLDNPVSKKIFNSFDVDFYKKIFWIKHDEVVFVKGNLLVTTPDMHPCIMSCKLINYLIKWFYEKLPEPSKEKYAIYYHRSLDTSTRIVNKKNNQDILSVIKKNMSRKNVKGNLIIFDPARNKSISKQIKLFRNAHTVIGPHGTGMANVLWSDILGKSPIKFLEFIPGDNGYSAQVQHRFNGYHNVLSGLPLDYHCLLYEPESTQQETFICLDHLRMALDSIWPEKKQPCLFL